ncbi:hypothetical protein [Bacillus thuringiensis]|uniref:hypothetical protein n=1 Tax=Bacillus thuringiensis TaxID=1428 RepID=UPI003BF69FDB|nr:hypothetical protein [Bacillus cereus]
MVNEITHEFVADITDRSLGVKLIVTGLARLVEEEGYTPHDALRIAHYTGHNCFHALVELKKEEM